MWIVKPDIGFPIDVNKPAIYTFLLFRIITVLQVFAMASQS